MNTPVTFAWKASTNGGVIGYDVLVAQSGNNSSGSVACSATGAAAPTQCTTNSGFSAGAYNWLVRAKFANCSPGVDSAPATFTAGCPTTPPTLQSPASDDTNVSTTPTLQWSAVSGASGYEVFLGPATTNISGCVANPIGTSSTNSFKAPTLQPGTIYEWKIEVFGANGCPGMTSACERFTTATPCSPVGNFTPTSPANGSIISDDTPTLQWSQSAGADHYVIHVGTSNPPQTSASDPQVSSSTTAYDVHPALPAGTYYWYVDAIPACGTAGTTSSPVGKFTIVNVTACPTTATTLVSPAANATGVTSPVTFKWISISGAAGYNLYVNDDLVATTSDTQATGPLPDNTTVTWYVDTLYKGCPAVRSQKSTFTTAQPATCPTGSITLLTPANGATVSGDNKIAFSWTGINGASAYRLYVSIDGASAAQVAHTTDTNATVSLPSGSVIWAVEALFPSIGSNTANSCPSIVSPYGKFTIAKAANCDAHKAVTLVSPISGNTTSPVDFTWTATDPTATLYQVFISVNAQPFADLGVTTATHLKVDVPPGTIVWFVQSFFQGCPALNATAATFTSTPIAPRCPTAAPTPLAPVNNAQVTSPVLFTWIPVTGAEDYRILASKDGSDFFLLAEDIDTPSVTRNLAPGNYTWFVEATFKECASTRSARSKFVVTQGNNCPTAGAQLVSPADGATNVTSPVTFDWSDVQGATGYAVIISHNDGSPTNLDETRSSQTTKHLSPGKYEWAVVSFFTNCPPTVSAHHTFTVLQLTCPLKRPLLHLPPDGADVVSPVRFAWSNAGDGAVYKVWASVAGGAFSVIGTTTDTKLIANMPSGNVHWFVEALSTTCALASTLNGFVALDVPPCDHPARPQATVVGQVASGAPYSVRWTPIANTVHYELQEATTGDFAPANTTTQVVNDTSADFMHSVTAVTRYFYRVRAVSSCSDEHGPYSRVVSVFVVPAQRLASVEFGTSSKTTQTVKLPGQTPPTTFSVHADKPWVTVNPSSGPIGADGVTLTVVSDPSPLALGTNTATLIITYGVSSGSGKVAANGVSSGNVPVSVNLVTPVSPTGKNTPIPQSLIIPAVAHAAGANNSMFQSDVRIANVSATTQKYLLNFTLSGTDGTQTGQSTTIQIDPGAQMALDDILTSFFGNGSDGSGAAGVLEIRPLTSTSSSSSFSGSTGTPSIQTVAASKTYNVTSNGTFGQFIPAIPFAQFLGKTPDGQLKQVISLQQIAQSAAYRTNFGLVEGAGEPADTLVHVFDNAGSELAQIPISLQPGEHKQINSFLAVNNINVAGGRIEVEVLSPTGKVSAYASVVDNQTNDPLLVFPVIKGLATATRYTIPGVADLNNGFASWRSDLRLFNPGATPLTATLSYYPQGGATPPTPSTVTINPGEVKAVDNALQSLYNITNSGGAVVVSTPSTSALTVTARTYNQTSAGTYGQFIPAVTPAQSVGVGDRTLQLLQLETSSAYRTNIGLVETTGNPVTFDITVVPDGSKVQAKLSMSLNPNEFRQISLADFGFGTIYNTRVAIKVTSGTGRLTAYGSVIDQITQDPTYVPAQ